MRFISPHHCVLHQRRELATAAATTAAVLAVLEVPAATGVQEGLRLRLCLGRSGTRAVHAHQHHPPPPMPPQRHQTQQLECHLRQALMHEQ